MARFAIVQNFIRAVRRGINLSDTQADPGGGANIKAYHAQQPGDDSAPLAGDTVVVVETPRSNGFAAVGYIDPQNAQTAAPGERRVYGRAADGKQVNELYLHGDGRATLSNDVGFVDLAADGTITLDDGAGGSISISGGVVTITGSAINLVGPTDINGFTVSESGEATDANNIGLGTHSHTQEPDSAGNQQRRTDAASNP